MQAPPDSINPFGSQSMQTLMDRLLIRNNNRFFLNKDILRHGVFLSSGRCLADKVHKKYMQHTLIPVADRSGDRSLLRHVCFDRTTAKNQVLPRGGRIYGGRENISNFVASLYLHRKAYQKNINTTTTGVYWDNWHIQPMSIHPYLDLDMSGLPHDTSFDHVFTYVWSVINAMHKRFRAGTKQANFEVVILMNKRTDKGKLKYSFHLHWPELVLCSMSSMAQLAHDVALECPPPADANGRWLDNKVYAGKNQLLRTPFCGKMGNGQATLLPISPSKTHTGPEAHWQFTYRQMETIEEVASIISKSCTCTAFPEKYVEVQLTTDLQLQPQQTVIRHFGLVPPTEEDTDNMESWMGFWKPILTHFVLPHYIALRKKEAAQLGVACTFPDVTTLPLNNIQRLTCYPASFCIPAPGDTFCCYDTGATPHVHSFDSNSISYIVDLNKGCIAQQCQKCRPTTLVWHHFIRTNDLTFQIMSKDKAVVENTGHVSCTIAASLPSFFLSFFSDVILFQRDNRSVLAYDDKSGCWVGGSDGNRIILGLVSKLNQLHKTYIVNRCLHQRNHHLTAWTEENPDATEDEQKKEHKNLTDVCRKAIIKSKPLWNLTLAARKDLLSCLQPDQHVHQVDTMEPHPHLVPLLDKQCLDVYTWTTRTIRPDDYFISVFNGRLLHVHDEQVREFEAWQMQVCCGDREYQEYKLRIMGISLTLFNFDRCFYMPYGPVGRNGKSSESFLFNELCMRRTPARGYNIAREYLTKAGQDRKGANAADTVLMDMSNKSVIIADECRDAPLDGALMKTIVSGDTMSARNLYEKERTNINIRGSLWIIGNKTLKLDYSDNALMNRMRILPYNAQWVAHPAEIKAQMTDTFQKMWVFQDDPYFKDKTLKSWTHAMLTSTLYALHKFLRSMEPDPEDPSKPNKLSVIPVPRAVQKATAEKIEHEQPILEFIKTYMGSTKSTHTCDYVTVEKAFRAYAQFGKNVNSLKIKHMNRAAFQEALLQHHIETIITDDGLVFQFYKMIKEVPNYDPAVSADGAVYVPPLVIPGDIDDDTLYSMHNPDAPQRKRRRTDYNDLDEHF